MNRIKDLREDADMKQSELAETIGITQQSLSRYEREETEPPKEVWIKLANYFNVTVDYIMAKTNNPTGEDFTKDMTEEEIQKMKEYKELLLAKRKVEEKDKISNLKKNA